MAVSLDSNYSARSGSAKFLLGVPSYAQLAPTRIPEVAFIGRSNVGKSSLLNRLLGTTSLVRVSSTPGKTQEINLFQVDLRSPSGEQSPVVLADLPGYGFAKLSKGERERMGRLTAEYISKRKELEIVMLLNDSKREPERDELSLVSLAVKSNRSLMIVLTKVDRLNQKEKAQQVKAIAAAYKLEPEQLVLTGKDMSIQPVWNLIGATLWGDSH